MKIGIKPVLLVMQTYLDIGYIIVLFVIILFGAYYVSKHVGNFQIKKSNNNNMKIIGVISVGPQKTLQLIKVGKEIILIGVSKDNITYIKEMPIDSLGDQLEDNIDNDSFNKHFERFINKRKNNSQTIDNGEGKNEK